MTFLTRKGFLIEEQGMTYLADHRPEKRPGPSIDANRPDPPPNSAPTRFSP